jgi:hypothetical protein
MIGRYRFEFEYAGIGWILFGRYNTDNLSDAKRAAIDIARTRMLDGRLAQFRAVRVVDDNIAGTHNPHAAPRKRVKFVARLKED